MPKVSMDIHSRKVPLHVFRPTQSPRRLRQRSAWLVLAFWLIISAYPSYLYWTRGLSSCHSKAPPPQATVTETLTVPELRPTAVPGALDSNHHDQHQDRMNDLVDTFRHYKTSETCKFSSLDLHGPFHPLCSSKEQLLDAMSGGGRLGLDAPYSPRECDMRWFSTDEICTILAKFDKVFILGDSMMRNLATALHILLRGDLVNGGRATWRESPPKLDCSCDGPFENSNCSDYSVATTRVVLEKEPEVLLCPKGSPAVIEFNHLLEYPIKDIDLQELKHYLPSRRPRKPLAFVMGGGLWNDLVQDQTIAWIDQVLGAIEEKAPYLKESGATFPKLFLTPNAAGPNKPFIFQARQGNIALSEFENQMRPRVQEKGFDHLGTYNASIQTHNPDGTHGSIKLNLLKAMMVLNWLNALKA